MVKKIFRHKYSIALASALMPIVFGILIAGGAYLYFLDRIYPNVTIAGMQVGRKTAAEATQLLSATLINPKEITLVYQDERYNLALADINFSYDIDKSVEDALIVGRTGHVLTDIKSIGETFLTTVSLDPRIVADDEKLSTYVGTIAGQIAIAPVDPFVRLSGDKIIIEKGKKGEDVNVEQLKDTIYQHLRKKNQSPIRINLTPVDPTLTDEEVEILSARAKNLIGKSIVITSDDKTITLSDRDLVSMVWPKGGYYQKTILEFVTKAKSEVDRDPQSAKFVFEEGRVKEFAPSKDGLEIKTRELTDKITQALTELENTGTKQIALEAPVAATPPQVTNAEVNNLGIKERIGRGTSRFRGSIPSRIHNVALATSRINGALIPPGETFSFNNALGDVSKLTGYKEAYIIQNGKTVLGDGGGVCQVSTTLFRAALNAGLPIIERRAHAYRVYYYEQDAGPGLDATVYSPTTDFKIKNDTPGHILIQATADTKNLTVTFELYGTSDGRVATTTKPVITESVDPGDDVYIDDATLPTGQVKQTEHKAFGAKVSFDYSVTRAGETIYTKKFISNYRPWANVFMRGTGPVQ